MNKKGKVEYLRKKKDILVIGKGIKDIRTSRNRDIKCFCYLGFGHIASQYPNKRVMVMKANNKVRLMRRMKMSPLIDADDVCVEYLIKKETLVVRRALNMHVKVDDLKDQKENIFQVRCHV